MSLNSQVKGGVQPGKIIQRMIAKAKELGSSPNSFFADQFNNPNAAFGYKPMAEEIWDELDQKVDAFVQSVGTAQCITGVAAALRKLNSSIHITAVEPSESPVLAGGAPGPHKIEGVGPGFIPPIWSDGLADEIIQISTSDAKDMARRLAREEALFAGTSTGANVLAAIQVASRLGSGHTVATVACDSGLKYLSTDLYTFALE